MHVITTCIKYTCLSIIAPSDETVPAASEEARAAAKLSQQLQQLQTEKAAASERLLQLEESVQPEMKKELEGLQQTVERLQGEKQTLEEEVVKLRMSKVLPLL